MVPVAWDRYPLVADLDAGRRWLQFTANVGRAPNTVDAYGRGLNDYLRFCATVHAEPVTAKADVLAAWIADMRNRPNIRAAKATHLSAVTGLSMSTIQQRLVAVRGFYAHLVEDGVRACNPVRSGERGRSGRRGSRGLVRHTRQAPWVPAEWQWPLILDAVRELPLRERLMFCLAYDGALRREELVLLEVDDFDPAYSLIRLRAETTKSLRSREVAYGATSASLLVSYLRQRHAIVGRRRGPVWISCSRRNYGSSLSKWSWSKTMQNLSTATGLPLLSAHTLRHLRLTDLARAGWTIDQIGQFAGHADLETTMIYLHLSGRDLLERFHQASQSLHAERERLLASLAQPL